MLSPSLTLLKLLKNNPKSPPSVPMLYSLVNTPTVSRAGRAGPCGARKWPIVLNRLVDREGTRRFGQRYVTGLSLNGL